MSTTAALLLAAATLHTAAPEETQGTVGASDPATSGKTDIEGLDTFATAADKPAEETDATELRISAGGILSTGNARSLAATGAGDFRLRRGAHQFGAIFAGNYAQAAADRDSDIEPTVGNVQGRVRYDWFFAERWSAFSMVTARHDPFQGLALRLNVDPGVAFYALTGNDHRLWFELGYDFQYDIRTDEARIVRDDMDMPTGEVLAPTRINHAARMFAGYTNHLSEYVTFDTGLEYLQSVIKARAWRINYDAALTAQLGGRFALATTFTLRVDNDPLPDVKKIDTVTAVNLVVTLLGAKEKKEES